MHLLVVEDSSELRKPIVAGLVQSGYSVEEASNGRVALAATEARVFDLIVLDIMLPGLDGLSLLRRLRAGGSPTRILLLTARDAVEDRVAGLRAGADDYLVKPFAFDELLARIEALLRRGRETLTELLRVDQLEIDVRGKCAFANGVPIPLTAREYAILEQLAVSRGRVVSRREIEQNVYDDQVEPMSNVVDSAICVLRRKLNNAGIGSLIQTRRGQGYIIPSEAT
jgi:DNA-binding response OmpR family regulator